MSKTPSLTVDCVVFHSHRVVLIRRAFEPFRGFYALPGGYVDTGETVEMACAREMKEETGLKIKIGRPFFVNEWRPQVRGEQWQIIGTFFECQADSDEVVLSNDHDHFKWIDPKEYQEHNLIENLHGVFEAYLEQRI